MLSSSHVVVICMFISTVLCNRGPYVPGGKKPVVSKPVVIPEEPAPEVIGNSNTDQQSGNIQVKGGTDDEAMRHIEDLENTVSTMKEEKLQTDQLIASLRMSLINLQRTMSVMAAKVSELDKLANQNKELTRLLTYFETFFGVLYSEAPEAFDSTIPVETRLSKMNAYLGNVEAELAGIRPKPPVVQEPEPRGVSDEIATAMVQLSQENAKLSAKVSNLENEVATTSEEVEQVKKAAVAPSSRGANAGPPYAGAGCTCPDSEHTEITDNRLEVIESTLDLLINATVLRPAQETNFADTTGISSKKASQPVSTATLITEEDLELWRSLMHGSADSRGVSSTRKSIFSGIRSTYLSGSTERQPISFDSVHINKGNHFVNNTYFTCSIEGFYFFQFNIRSYDGYYMGVALVHNNEMATSIYTDASERSIMQSQSIILQLKQGDQVWLELGSSERFAVHSDVHKYVTFNGFLIFKGK